MKYLRSFRVTPYNPSGAPTGPFYIDLPAEVIDIDSLTPAPWESVTIDRLTATVWQVTPHDAVLDASSILAVCVVPESFAVGPQGEQGVQGIQGIQGLKGDKGDKGDKGLQGDRGIQGLQGVQGIQGLKGDKGDQGIQGPAGVGVSPAIYAMDVVGTLGSGTTTTRSFSGSTTIRNGTGVGAAMGGFYVAPGQYVVEYRGAHPTNYVQTSELSLTVPANCSARNGSIAIGGGSSGIIAQAAMPADAGVSSSLCRPVSGICFVLTNNSAGYATFTLSHVCKTSGNSLVPTASFPGNWVVTKV